MRIDRVLPMFLKPRMAAIIAIVTLASPWANGAVFSWDGGGADNNWSTINNWNPDVAPANNGTAEIRLIGTVRPTPSVNTAWSVSKFVYTSLTDATFTLGGSALTITATDALTVQDTSFSPQRINNAISFTSSAPAVHSGNSRTIIFGGALSSSSPLVFKGYGSSTIAAEVASGGTVNAPTVEVSAATATHSSQPVILRLSSPTAIASSATLKLTPETGLTNYAKADLNFTGTLTVAGLILNGASQPAGTYNASNQPNYFSGTGSLSVSSGATQTYNIANWTEWGPSWGRSGLEVQRYNDSGHMSPQEADIDNNATCFGRGMLEWRNIAAAADGTVNFLNSTTFPRIAQSRPTASYEWAGMTEHLHTYIMASATVSKTAAIQATFTPSSSENLIYLNGTRVTSGQTITLVPGWNRLMVRARSPRVAEGQTWTAWTAKVSLTNAPAGVVFSQVDPNRKVVVTDLNNPFRYRSQMSRTADGDLPVFVYSESVALTYKLSAGVGKPVNYTVSPAKYQDPSSRVGVISKSAFLMSVYTVDPARLESTGPYSSNVVDPSWTVVPNASWATSAGVPVSLRLKILNDLNGVVQNQTYPLSWGTAPDSEGEIHLTAPISLSLGTLALGHYRMYGDFLDATGKVLAHDFDHSFAVLLNTPINKSSDDYHPPSPWTAGLNNNGRVLCSVDHFFNTVPATQAQLRWLKKAGFTRMQKLWDGWSRWAISHDTAGNVTLGTATGIDGDLNAATAMGIDVIGDITEGYFNAGSDNIGAPAYGAPTLIQNLTAGSPAWFHYWEDMGTKLAQKYKANPNGSIHVWSGINEFDSDADAAHASRSAQLHSLAAQHMVNGLLIGDPISIYISSSVVDSGRRLAPHLGTWGWWNVPDAADVHTHPHTAPEPNDLNFPAYSTIEGRTQAFNAGFTGPIVYGETDAIRAHNPGGGIGMAGSLVKSLAWAVNHRTPTDGRPPVWWLSYLVPYDAPRAVGATEDDWNFNAGFNNGYGDPLPVVNACRMASTYMDGRALVAPLTGLPAGVSHIRVTSTDANYPETVIIWRTAGATSVTLNITNANGARVHDLLGRLTSSTTGPGSLTLTVDTTPRYVRARF
ncbi:MAG: hypothetical protein ACREH8_20630 [Opitutaceae bacterium]